MQAPIAVILIGIFVSPTVAKAPDTSLIESGQVVPHEDYVAEKAEAVYDAAMATVAASERHDSDGHPNELAKASFISESNRPRPLEVASREANPEQFEKLQADSRARSKEEVKQLMRQKMKSVPPWAIKEFKKVLNKERTLHTTAEALVQNLTRALNATTAALDEKDRTLREQADTQARKFAQSLQESSAKIAEAQHEVQDMKAKVDAANARTVQIQDELTGELKVTSTELATVRAEKTELRDRNGGYAADCQRMIVDMHATLADERGARMASEKNASDLGQKLMNAKLDASQNEKKLSADAEQIKALLQQKEAENVNLTRNLTQSQSKLVMVTRKLKVLANASKKLTNHLMDELKDAKKNQQKIVKRVVSNSSKGVQELSRLNSDLTKKLKESEEARKKERAVYAKVAVAAKKINATDMKLKYAFVKQHGKLKELEKRAKDAEQMVAAEHREMMEGKQEVLTARQQMSRKEQELEQAKRLAVKLHRKSKMLAARNNYAAHETVERDNQEDDSDLLEVKSKLKEETDNLNEARQVLKETYGALDKESQESEESKQKTLELAKALAHKKAQLRVQKEDQAMLKQKLQEEEAMNYKLAGELRKARAEAAALSQQHEQKHLELQDLSAHVAQFDTLDESHKAELKTVQDQLTAAAKRADEAAKTAEEAKAQNDKQQEKLQTKEEDEKAMKEKLARMEQEGSQREQREAELTEELKKAQARASELQEALDAQKRSSQHHVEHSSVDVSALEQKMDSAEAELKEEGHKASLLAYEHAQDQEKIKKISNALIKEHKENVRLRGSSV